MKIDKNYFKSETKISSSNRVASDPVYGGWWYTKTLHFRAWHTF